MRVDRITIPPCRQRRGAEGILSPLPDSGNHPLTVFWIQPPCVREVFLELHLLFGKYDVPLLGTGGGRLRRSALCGYERGEGAAAYAVASAADLCPPAEMESSAMESTWSRRRVGTTSRYATSSKRTQCQLQRRATSYMIG